MSDLLEGILERVRDGLSDPPDYTLVAPGSTVAWDNMCGQLWVRLEDSQAVYQSGLACAIGMELQIEIGIVRCVSTVDDRGRAPKPATLTQEAAEITRDMNEIYEALSDYEPEGVHRFKLVRWEPQGPEGGAAGGLWHARVWTY